MNKKICQNCGIEYPDSSLSCSICGGILSDLHSQVNPSYSKGRNNSSSFLFSLKARLGLPWHFQNKWERMLYYPIIIITLLNFGGWIFTDSASNYCSIDYRYSDGSGENISINLMEGKVVYLDLLNAVQLFLESDGFILKIYKGFKPLGDPKYVAEMRGNFSQNTTAEIGDMLWSIYVQPRGEFLKSPIIWLIIFGVPVIYYYISSFLLKRMWENYLYSAFSRVVSFFIVFVYFS